MRLAGAVEQAETVELDEHPRINWRERHALGGNGRFEWQVGLVQVGGIGLTFGCRPPRNRKRCAPSGAPAVRADWVDRRRVRTARCRRDGAASGRHGQGGDRCALGHVVRVAESADQAHASDRTDLGWDAQRGRGGAAEPGQQRVVVLNGHRRRCGHRTGWSVRGRPARPTGRTSAAAVRSRHTARRGAATEQRAVALHGADACAEQLVRLECGAGRWLRGAACADLD